METNANQKVSCVANYAYDASEADELSVRPGDVLRDVERLPGGWWRGELRGRRGMFPDNFVSVLTEQTNNRSGSGVQGRCRAVFSYQPANPDELPLCVGDVLEVLGEVEEGWWQGRRQGRVGVFPSNFVVMLDPPQPVPPVEPAPALPPKPVKEQCRVLFPYTAVNDDELTLAEGDLVTIVSKDAPDRGWWRGELRGRVGLFPDNFVQLLPAVAATEVEEKKPDRPPSKTPTSGIYPVLNKYSEKTASVKELTTSKISMHKENSISKESSTQSTITHTNKTESEKIIHSETVSDGTLDGQVKKPPVPLKKSPTPSAGVGGLFSGLKSKMLSSNDKEKSSTVSSGSGSSSGGEWDRPDGAAVAKPSATFDRVERAAMLNDPRAGRVKAPRRRPPSQVIRDDSLQHIGLSNGHETETVTVTASERTEKPPKPEDKPEKGDEIKPRTREWEKHKAPWMEELKLNQAKKTVSLSKAGGGSTDRILECGLEEKRSSHSMEMSKSTSSISSRMSVLESYEETKVRHSLDSKKDVTPAHREDIPSSKPTLHSPTAAGRTLLNMLDEIKKPAAPPPPLAPARPSAEHNAAPAPASPSPAPAAPAVRHEKPAPAEKTAESVVTRTSGMFDKTSTLERIEKVSHIEEKIEKPPAPQPPQALSASLGDKGASTLERLKHSFKAEKTEKVEVTEKSDKGEGTEALIAQLNSRIQNLEKIIEVQNTMFTTAVSELTAQLRAEADARAALRRDLDKLALTLTHV